MKNYIFIFIFLTGMLSNIYGQDADHTVEELNQAIKREPNNAELYTERATVYGKSGRYAEALDDFNKAIYLNPTANSYNGLSLTYIYLRNIEEAINAATKSIELDPYDDVGYANRGFGKFLMGRFDEALDDIDKSIAIEPSDVSGYYLRGEIFNIKERYNDAIIDFNRVIAMQPDHGDAYKGRAFAYYKMEKYKEALKDIDKAINIYPDANKYEGRGKMYQALAEQTKDRKLKAEYLKKAEEDFNMMKKLENIESQSWTR
jgi:tetratricopeptide (TPR) repeat protein